MHTYSYIDKSIFIHKYIPTYKCNFYLCIGSQATLSAQRLITSIIEDVLSTPLSSSEDVGAPPSDSIMSTAATTSMPQQPPSAGGSDTSSGGLASLAQPLQPLQLTALSAPLR